MLSLLIPALGSLIGKAIDRAVPDASKAQELTASVIQYISTSGLTELQGAVQIITAEANGESWVQRNWRPLTMLTFVGLVVAKWLGFSAPGISEAIELKLFDIIEIGLGGYVVGRSAEKIAPAIAEIFKK